LTSFNPGDAVRVREAQPSGHVRTPSYVRGKLGWIERVHGEFRNPESLAYGGDGLPRQPLYMVGFHQPDLWFSRYTERGTDCLYVDIYEHWLEAL
jgi:Nitrile hydratase beta subunit, C-terminal